MKGKQLGEVFDDYFETKGKLNNAVLFPGKDAPPEEVKAFLKKMDIPEKPEEYSIDPKKLPDTIPDEAKAEAVKELADFCHKAGLTKKQGEKVYDQYCSIIRNIQETQIKRLQELSDSFEERLVKDVGDEKKSTEVKEYFKRALIALNDKKLVGELKESGMLYSTTFVKALADLWKAGNQEPPIPQAIGGKEEAKKDALPKSTQFEERYGGK